jgi:hypothetical protein
MHALVKRPLIGNLYLVFGHSSLPAARNRPYYETFAMSRAPSMAIRKVAGLGGAVLLNFGVETCAHLVGAEDK